MTKFLFINKKGNKTWWSLSSDQFYDICRNTLRFWEKKRKSFLLLLKSCQNRLTQKFSNNNDIFHTDLCMEVYILDDSSHYFLIREFHTIRLFFFSRSLHQLLSKKWLAATGPNGALSTHVTCHCSTAKKPSVVWLWAHAWRHFFKLCVNLLLCGMWLAVAVADVYGGPYSAWHRPWADLFSKYCKADTTDFFHEYTRTHIHTHTQTHTQCIQACADGG